MHRCFPGHSLVQYDYERRANQRIVRLQLAVERTEALNDKLAREISHLARQNWRLRAKEMKTESLNKIVVGSPCSKQALQRASRVLQYSKQKEIHTKSGEICTKVNSNSLGKSGIEEAISNSHKRIEKWERQLQQIRQISVRLYDSPLISKSDYQFPSPERTLLVQKSPRNEQPQNNEYGKEQLSAILKQVGQKQVGQKQVGQKKRRRFLRVVTAGLKRRAFKENDGQAG